MVHFALKKEAKSTFLPISSLTVCKSQLILLHLSKLFGQIKQ